MRPPRTSPPAPRSCPAGRRPRRRPTRGTRRRAGPASPAARCSDARDLAGVLPVLEVRRDLAPHEPRARRHLAQSPVTQQDLGDVHVPRPRPLAEALGLRVEPRRGGHARPSSPWTTTLTPPRLGSACTSTSRSRGLGQQRPDEVRRDRREQPGHPGVVRRDPSCRTHRPRLASPPLSPDRACTNVPSGRPPLVEEGAPAPVTRPAPDESAGTSPGFVTGLRPSSTSGDGSSTTSVRPSAWCTVWVTAERSTYSAR